MDAMDGEEDDFLLLWLLFDLNFGHNDNNDLTVMEKKWTVIPVDVSKFQSMGDPAFRLHFRLNSATFEALMEVIANYMEGENLFQRGRMPELDLMLMKSIWILATPDLFRSVAVTFGTYPSTAHRHYTRIIATLCDLAPRFIKWPDADERRTIANSFRTYSGFPGIVACIYGTLVTVTAPLIQAKRYVDRHHQYSINIQVVCDRQLLVRDLHVGEAGSMNDARVFRRSPLCKELLSNPDIFPRSEYTFLPLKFLFGLGTLSAPHWGWCICTYLQGRFTLP
ncbi:Protein ANTAGONIST OF LIKE HETEROCHROMATIN PROTEIN 1 [Frankliniella fusca]|uniref:Protein ANTAGONIST OF LIKE HETEROCHROMATIN PROTEIN 1 n=1 Tax=Frankliniella fusca TaxID=407009 RepID=A0AAE1GP69_9NEOP|nr:Protein ANTAGONIST OF LIKE HETEROCHROMATIN PROTEIN 1 [Frankliniella fusca]